MNEQELQEVYHQGKPVYFPAGMPKEEIEAKLSEYEINQVPQDGPVTSKEEGPSWLTRNLDVPASILASATGAAAAGSRFGPAGAIGGAITGGVVGTFAGVSASTYLTEGEADYQKAVKESLIGLGIDLGTGLVGKYIPDGAWLRMMKKAGFTPEQAVDKIVAMAGTPESRKQTQNFLSEVGLSLTPYQTGFASGYDVIRERLANVGLFSRSSMTEHYTQVQGAIRDKFDEVFNVREETGLHDLGSYMSGIIEAGREGLSNYYSKSLDDILTKTRVGFTSAAPLKARISKIASENNIYGQVLDKETGELTEAAIDNSLSGEVRQFLGAEFSKLEDVVNLDAKGIIALEKKISQKQRELKEAGSFGAADDLSRIGEELKETYATMLTRIDPNQAERYIKLKNTYKNSIRNLMPDINQKVMLKALETGDYTQFGRLTVENGTVEQTKKFVQSIRSAYALANKNGTLNKMPFKKEADALDEVRKTFITNTFPDLLDESTDLKKLLPKIRKFRRGDKAAKLRTLFGGEQYGALNKLFNAIENTSISPSGDVGSLMFRNKEFGAVTDLLGVMGAAGGLGMSTSGEVLASLGVLGASAAVLYTPTMMSKAIRNPKLANKLLSVSKRDFDSQKKQLTAYGMVVNDFLKALDSNEIEELKIYIEGLSEANNKRAEREVDEQTSQVNMMRGF